MSPISHVLTEGELATHSHTGSTVTGNSQNNRYFSSSGVIINTGSERILTDNPNSTPANIDTVTRALLSMSNNIAADGSNTPHNNIPLCNGMYVHIKL